MSFREMLWGARGVHVPSKIRKAVYATLQAIGIDQNEFAEYLADDVARELHCLQNERDQAHRERVRGLIEANSREVERRRLAERTIAGIMSYAQSQDRCTSGDPYLPGINAIIASTGYSPT